MRIIASYLLFIVIVLAFPVTMNAQWEQVSGIGGRSTDALVSSGPALYSWSKDQALPLARSLDSGKHWEHLASVSGVGLKGLFAKDSFCAIVGYPLQGNGRFVVLVSHDYGNHFNSSPFAEDDSMKFVPNGVAFGTTKVYLTGESYDFTQATRKVNLVSSTDLGITWRVDASNVGSLMYLIKAYEYGDYLFLAGSTTLYRHNLSSGALDSVHFPKPDLPGTVRTITSDSKYLYASGGAMTFRSLDSGEHWDTLNVNVDFELSDTFFFYGSFWSGSSSPAVVSSFFRYWNPIHASTVQGSFGIVATGAGIFRTKVGTDVWKMVDTNLASVSAVRMYHLGNMLYAFTESGLHHSTDGGTNWIHYEPQSDVDWKVESTNNSRLSGTPNNLWLLDEYTDMWQSIDTGRSWTPIARPKNNGATLAGLVVQNKTVLLGYEDGVDRSTDQGLTWSTYRRDYIEFPFIDAGSTIYSYHDDTPLDHSTDFGLTWSPGTIPIQYKTSSTYAADGSNVVGSFNNVFVSDSLFVSTNRGISWTHPRYSGKGITVLALRKNQFAIAQGNAIDTSGDLGKTIRRVADTLPSPIVHLDYVDNYLYAATLLDGFFRLRLGASAGVNDNTVSDTASDVHVEYAGDRIVLRFPSKWSVPAGELQFSDRAGRRVALSLVSSETGSFTLQTSNLSAGPYYILLPHDGYLSRTNFMVAR